jgi:hypothetical protein
LAFKRAYATKVVCAYMSIDPRRITPAHAPTVALLS